jgi:hypothetical protein
MSNAQTYFGLDDLVVYFEVRVNLVPYVWDGRSGLSVDTVDAQVTEKRSAMATSDWVT